MERYLAFIHVTAECKPFAHWYEQESDQQFGEQQTFLWWMLKRLQGASHAIEPVVLTSEDDSNAALLAWCESHNVRTAFVEDIDPLTSIWENILHLEKNETSVDLTSSLLVSHVLWLTGECVLIDPNFIDRCIELAVHEALDFTAVINPNDLMAQYYPQQFEVFSRAALKSAWRDANTIHDRKGVGTYIIRRIERFSRSFLATYVEPGSDDAQQLGLELNYRERSYRLQSEADVSVVQGIIDQQLQLQPLMSHLEIMQWLSEHDAFMQKGQVLASS